MKAILRIGFLALAIMAPAVPADAGPLEDGNAATRAGYSLALQLLRKAGQKILTAVFTYNRQLLIMSLEPNYLSAHRVFKKE